MLYFAVFARVKLYADAGLQVIYLVLQFYGWCEWVRGGAGKSGGTVSRAPQRVLVSCIAFGAAGTVTLGTLLGRYTDQALPYWDSGITAFSLVAQWMLARKYLENWLLWAAIDVIAIGVYWTRHLLPTARAVQVLPPALPAGYQRWRMTLFEAQEQA